jgi:small subunit ribosomal protein S15
MARMHSRDRGKAGSNKPVEKNVPSWVSYKPKEVEALIVKLAKQEKQATEIGLILRDSYGIPNVKALLGKKVCEVLKDKKLATKIPEDLSSLIKRDIELMKHLEANHKDMTAKRGLQLTESKIKRLIKYYKTKNIIDKNFIFDRNKAKLLLE